MLFNSVDYNIFGRKLKIIREKTDKSISKVSKDTGIKRETLSNIEKGISIPRLDTLDILSKYYNINIFKLLNESNNYNKIEEYYTKIDYFMIQLDYKNLSNTINEIRTNITNDNFLDFFISKEEFNNYFEFIDLLDLLYNKNDNEIISKICTKLGLNSYEDLTLKYLESNFFTFLEYRLLMIISMCLINTACYDTSITILNYCYENISYYIFNSEDELKMRVKFCLNLSYLYHLKSNYNNSLLLSNKGIYLLNISKSSYLLAQLLARKCVAQMMTGANQDEIKKTYIKVFLQFSIDNDSVNFKIYKNMFFEKYKLYYSIVDVISQSDVN